MKRNLLIFVTMLLVYVSSMALEPVRVGLTYPSGLQSSNPKVEVDLFDYNGSGQKYPLAAGTKQDFGNIQANASGGAQIILGHNLVGEDDPDWGPLSVAVANNSTMVRVYVDGTLVTQLKLKDLIEAQQNSGDGDVIPSGIDSDGGVVKTSNPNDDIVIGAGAVNNPGGVETKMFFENTKASFRAGTVNGGAWDVGNLGQSSFATGENTIASGTHSVATGENTTASGAHSSASGEGTVARATHEVAIGSYNTDYTPAVDATDRAFSIGNGTGTGTGSHSNAFVVRKNGNTEIAGKVTIGSGATTYELPSARGTDKQILQSDASGVLTFVDNVPGLGNANTWTAKQTFNDASITVPTGSSVTLDGLKTADNQSLYIDSAGTVTASNGAPARAASGIASGTHIATATTTQTISDGNVKTGSVIIVTYQGTVNASYRITAITNGTGFTLEFSAALVASETIHYMIIN